MLKQNRFLSITTSGLLAVGLSGCFQNYGGDSLYSKSSQRSSGFIDSTPSGGGSFDGTGLQASAALVNTYAGTNADGVYDGSYGMVINLDRSFSNAIGSATLADLIARSATDATVLSMPVELLIEAFRIKATFPFGKVVQNRKLLNIMVIRPRLSGVDFASGYIPDTAPIVQTNPRNLYTYGGIENGDAAIARITFFFRNTNPYGTGFLPSGSNPQWGQGVPAGDATANAEFMRVTPQLGKIALKINSDVSGKYIGSPNFESTQTNPGNYLIAIHTQKVSTAEFAAIQAADAVNQTVNARDYVRYPFDSSLYYKITRAYMIFSTPEAPDARIFCDSSYNGNTLTHPLGNIEYTDPRSCDCRNVDMETLALLNGPAASTALNTYRAQVIDYCRANTTNEDDLTPLAGKPSVPNKIKYLRNAIQSKPIAPTSGILTPSSIPVNDILFSPI